MLDARLFPGGLRLVALPRSAATTLRAAWPALALLLAAGCGQGDGGKTADPTTQFQGKTVVCVEGASKCADLATAEACTDNAWRQTPCGDGVCEDGACRPKICVPNVATCRPDGVAICSARGTSFLPATPCGPNTTCTDGACLPDACVAGTALCTGNGLAVCRADGSGFDVTPCAKGRICAVGGDGVAACLQTHCQPNEISCDGAIQTECDALGLHQKPIADCASEGKICQAGACVELTCVPNVQTCLGGQQATCAADGMGWVTTSCGDGKTCKNNLCIDTVCVPGESFCDGQRPAVCHADGLGFDPSEACTNGQTCKQGGCVGDKFVCGDGLCDGDEAKTCADDCKPAPFPPQAFDALAPGTPTAQPRAPRALLAKASASWTSARAMALHAGKLFVVDTDNGALVVMDAATLKIEATVPVGKRPDSVVVGPDGKVFVSVRQEAKIATLAWGAWATGQVLPMYVGKDPTGMALRNDGKVLYVALAGEDAIVGVEASSGVKLVRFPSITRPLHLMVRPDDTIVALSGRGQAFIGANLDLDAQLESAKLGIQPQDMIGSLTPVALRTFNPTPSCRDKLTIEARVANRAIAATLQPETGAVLVSHVLAMPGSSDDVLDSAGIKPVDIPQPPKVICSGGYGSTCKVVPPPPGKPPCVGAPARPYEPSVSAIAANGTVLATLTSGDMPIVDAESGRSFLARFDQPSDIAHHPTHTIALIAGRGSNNVLVINTASPDPMRWPIADIAVGAGPKAVAIAPKGDVAYVLCANDFTVHRVDLQPLLALAPALSTTTDPNALPKIDPILLGSAASAAYGVDPLPPAAQIGRQVFHFARNPRLSAAGRFACATCHLDGQEDHTVWFIAEGPRQTPALAGRLHDTAPYNWLGTKFKLTDNVINTTARMGGTGLLPNELEGLAAFLLQGLEPPPNPNLDPGGLTAQQLEGKAIFHDPKVECATCHMPGPGTDGAQHDVGTATEVEKKVAAAKGEPAPTYNTPSLRGLFYTAPYLHDGSAPTLHDALKKTATTMGHTDHLTPKQLDALVAYLKTL